MSSRAPAWHVVLIVEDNSDGQACMALARAMGLDLRLDWLPANGIDNIKRRGEQLIQLAWGRIRPGQGCVAVLLDRDGRDVTRAEPHRTIRRLCRQAGVPLLLSVESVEAWFLADAGCAAWLGLRCPANSDSVPDRRHDVERAYRGKARRPYMRRARRILAEKCDGSAPERSPSLRSALAHLVTSPCSAAGMAAEPALEE